MATFKKFEDVQAWQKARKATKQVYEITSLGSFAKDFGLRDQIRRASVSIMANIAEGCGRHTDKEFANFLNIARGSAAEVQSHLYIAFDLEYLEEDIFNQSYQMFDEISRMISGLSQHLRT